MAIFVYLASCNKKTDAPQPTVQTIIRSDTVADTIYQYRDRPEPMVAFGTVADNQGNSYKTLTIGGLTWMAENLRVQYYNNGDRIETRDTANTNLSPPRYWFNPDFIHTNGGIQNNDTILSYGRLYTWYAATDERGVCPSGWTIPTAFDYQALIDTLGGATIAGTKMKDSGRYWVNASGTPLLPDNSGTNTSGFSARGAGRHEGLGGYETKYYALYWTSTNYSFYPAYDTSAAYVYELYGGGNSVTASGRSKLNAYSVRCIKRHF